MKNFGSGLITMAACAAALLTPKPADASNFALMFDAGLRSMSNSPSTEKAIFDRKRGIGVGGGLAYERGSRWRFGVDIRRITRDGERAFAVDRNSEAFRLGHPLTLTLNESLLSASRLFGKVGPVSPYISVSAGRVSWKESSDIAGLVEKADGTGSLFEGRVGVERLQGRFRLAVEGGITMAPNTVGVGGISKVYEETDLGGLFVVVKLGFARR